MKRRPVGMQDLGSLEVDEEGNLYMKGKRIAVTGLLTPHERLIGWVGVALLAGNFLLNLLRFLFPSV